MRRRGSAGRWAVVLLAAAVLVATPVALARRPAEASSLPAAELAHRVQESAATGWSGLAETSGALQVPASDSFATLADLLGGQNTLRVWWRGVEDWRVDRIRSTGETDLFRHDGYLTRWVFESETATISPVSRIRLPDASDLLPPTLGRSMLQGAREDELTRLPTARVAGIDAVGLRLTPRALRGVPPDLDPVGPVGTVDHVDLWADPATGLAVRVQLYAVGERRPTVSATLTTFDRATPDRAQTSYSPSAESRIEFEESVDVAAAANAGAPYDLPVSLAGLSVRNGQDPGAVGIYGRGPTALIVLPLRGQVAGPLRERLRSSASATETAEGTLAPVGPIGVLLTPRRDGRGSVLLAGTVDAATLQRAATQLLAAG
ncbi:hypothetical protein [uncultured Friedmanniella sp.]|uniref:hypothetical protein n=1 Tax=uncultured Friedmanniella sp. TaxID=335381 RepID=UPI0035CA5A44